MNRYRYLLKNIGLLTIGNFASKLMAFLLVPIYTAVLSTDEYGAYELVTTTISLLLPILSLDIVEAVLRFPINNRDSDYSKQVFTIGVKYVSAGCILMIVGVYANNYFGLFPSIAEYSLFMVLLYIMQAFNQLLLNFTRALDRVREVTIAGILSAVSLLALNIVFLLVLKKGIEGFFVAWIISSFIGDLYYFFRIKAYNYIHFKKIDKALTRSMVRYSYPIIFNTIGWWVNNASDRYIVTWLCGIAVNGVYSVAYKIPSILSVLQAIFNQAWILSSVREFDAKDSNGFFKNVYNVYNCLMCVVCSGLIIVNKIIAKLLFASEFYNAWVYAPYLTIAVIFGTLAGVIGGVFSAVKDSKMFAISTCVGALANVVLNIVLVKTQGAIGAAIATLISSLIVWVLRLIHSRKYINLDLPIMRDSFVYALLIVQAIIMTFLDGAVLYFSEVVLLIMIIILFKGEILLLWGRFIGVYRRKRNG